MFELVEDTIALPKGAFARTHRHALVREGRPVLALTQGRQRAYAYPLCTPAGYAVTSECPADHPHHNSFWIAADHVHGRMPVAGGGFEEYTYNFYVDETFQGRAAGRIVETARRFAAEGEAACRVEQELDWRGPQEWGASDGRLVLRERRVMRIVAEPGLYVIDLDSRLSSAGWDVALGPTRHAYANLRVAETMTCAFGGIVQDDRGRRGGPAISGDGAAWVDFSGPVGGGHVAGVTLLPDPRDHPDPSWFVSDWGVITVGPFRTRGCVLKEGEEMRARYRVLVHDGDAEACDPARRHAEFVASLSGA